jgi:uroporphyrinogen-III decarboxylase
MEIYTKDDYEAIISRGWNGFLAEFLPRDGGFILSTGCECPIDAKFENVEAMLATARSHTYHGHDN